MPQDTSRSEEVIEDFKKHKLAANALRCIDEKISGFEADRAVDRRLAGIGVFIVVVLIGISAYFLLSASSVTLS